MAVVKRNEASNWKEPFRDLQEFFSTSFGFLFAVTAPILGLVAFIVLSQYDMPFIGAMTFLGAVFGDFALGFIASQLHKHGFFNGVFEAQSHNNNPISVP